MNAITPHEQFALTGAKHLDDELYMRRMFPALFTRHAHPKMSDRYGFTDTYHLLKYLTNRGYTVRTVQQSGKGQYGKTLTRLTHPSLVRSSDGSAELCLIDSHDGTSSIMVAMGWLRFVCANGLVLGDAVYKRRFRHNQPDLVEQIILDLEDAEEASVRSYNIIERMKQRQLTATECASFSRDVAEARFDLDPIQDHSRLDRAATMLFSTRRRTEDQFCDLYTVMNVLQENAMRGGFWYTHSGQTYKVRPMQSINREVTVNAAAWNGAVKLLEAVR